MQKESCLHTKKLRSAQIRNNLLTQKKPESWDDFFHKTPTVTKDFDMTRKQKTFKRIPKIHLENWAEK